MSIFNTIREYLGTSETTDVFIHDEDGNALTEDQLVDRRVEALTETIEKGEQSLLDLTDAFDETDTEFDLRLQACEAVLAKGENQDVTLNKEVLTEKRQKNFDKFLKDATRLKTKMDLQKAELEELEKGGAGSGRHKNLSHFTSDWHKQYQYGKPHQAATEIMQHQDELAAHHEKAKQTAGDFNSPGLSHAFHADVKAIHEGSKLGVAKHLQEYHKHSGEDNEYRGSKKASSELIEHVKDYHKKFNESAKKAGEFQEPGVRHAAKQDFRKAEDDELEKGQDDNLVDWFFNEDTDLEEFMEKATDLVSKATDEQQTSVGEFMKAWQSDGQAVDQRQAITAALTVSGLVQKKTEDLTDLTKAGEGSRGGKVIGHTKSGKPIYSGHQADHKDYKDFSAQDHHDASNLHYFEENKYIRLHHRDPLSGSEHVDHVAHHRAIARDHGNISRKFDAEQQSDLTKAEDYAGHYANVLIKDKDGRLLLLKRVESKTIEPGKYCPPGGHIDDGETIAQAAARELKEEANLTVKPEDLFLSCKSQCGDGKWAFYLSAPTYNEEMGLLAVLDGESNNAGWYSQDEWLKLDLIFDLKDHLLKMNGQDCENVTVIKGEEDEFEKGGVGSGRHKTLIDLISNKKTFASASHIMRKRQYGTNFYGHEIMKHTDGRTYRIKEHRLVVPHDEEKEDNYFVLHELDNGLTKHTYLIPEKYHKDIIDQDEYKAEWFEFTDEDLNELTKGGKPKVGEKKSFGGKEYSRTERGWKAKKTKGHTGHTAEQLATHAQSTSDVQLRKVSKNKEVHISLRDSARHELSTREKTSKVDKVSDLLTQIENKAKKEKLGVKDLVGQLREYLESEQQEKDKNKKVVEQQ